MPCLSARFVQEPPSLDVSSLSFTDRGYRRAVLVLLVPIGIAIEDGLLRPRHLWLSRGAKIGLHVL